MTYIELLKQWEIDLKSRNELLYFTVYPGDHWNETPIERRAEIVCDILTSNANEELDVRNF